MAADFVEFREEREFRQAALSVFEEVCREVGHLLPGAVVEHVGSTAIPGAVTKGDLDVCVLVDASAFSHADHLLGGRYTRNVGSHHSGTYSPFVDESKKIAVGIQLVVQAGPEDFFVLWRDTLRRSPDLLAQYNALKLRWQGRSHEGYRTDKSSFIEQVLESHSRST
jgi:GrpB-like predicted nucleotidyltransferase (UPF0157 family)